MRSRGLAVPDEQRAIRYLKQVGYYRLSPYMLPFQSGPGEHAFKPGTSFEDVLSLYVFDRKLRLLVMDGLERIEVAVRAGWTDWMATRTGDSHWYVQQGYFSDRVQHEAPLNHLRKVTESQLKRAGSPWEIA